MTRTPWEQRQLASRNGRHVSRSAGVGLFCGGAHRTVAVM